MQSVIELLDAIKAGQKITSDYKLAMYLGVSQGTVQNWRHGRSLPDQKAVTRIALELGLDPDVLLLQVESQRAATDYAKSAWLRIAQRLEAGAAHVAVLVAVGLVSMVSTPSAHAVVTSPAADLVRVCILCKVKATGLFRALRRAARSMVHRFAQGDAHVQSADTDAAILSPA